MFPGTFQSNPTGLPMSSIPVFDQPYVGGHDDRSGRFRTTGAREKKSTKQHLERVFKVIVIGLTVVLILELLFHFVVTPNLVIRNISVQMESSVRLTSDQVVELAGIHPDLGYFKLDEAVIAERVMRNPLVKSAAVEKVFPDGLSITLKGRTPLACSYVDVDGRIVPVVFDEEGVVFQVGSEVTDQVLPVVSGIDYTEVRPGVQLSARLHGFLEELKVLADTSPELYSLISEIKFDKKNNADFETLIFPSTHQIRVRIGSSINVSMLKSMVMFFALIENQDFSSQIEELDLRTGELVYRIRED